MRGAVLLLLLPLACTPQRPAPAPAVEGTDELVATADPPPAYHAYPEIPPEELHPRPPATGCAALPEPPAAPAETCTRVYSGPPITNHIPPQLVIGPMRARGSCVRRCYESGLPANAVASGRVSVQFVIDADGYVRRSKVRDHDGVESSVGACVAQQIVGMQFPVPTGGAITVIYPFRFAPP